MAVSLDSIYDRSSSGAGGEQRPFRTSGAATSSSAIPPDSVIDVGRGVGTWLDVARELGVKECLGVDGAYVEREALLIPDEAFLPLDLAGPGLPDAVAAVRPGRFDLVMCLEVAEHLPGARAASLVEELCRLGDVILFSAAIPFQGGTGHVNEQWPEFWALHFRSHGYACFDLCERRFGQSPTWSGGMPKTSWSSFERTAGPMTWPPLMRLEVAPLSAGCIPEPGCPGYSTNGSRTGAMSGKGKTGGLDALLSAWTEGGVLSKLFAYDRLWNCLLQIRHEKVLPWNRAERGCSPAGLIAEARSGAKPRSRCACQSAQQDTAAARDEITCSHANCVNAPRPTGIDTGRGNRSCVPN